MNKEEVEHAFKAFIELTLFPDLRTYTEGNLSKEEIDKLQQTHIINFINGLIPAYKLLPNRDEIIVQTLEKMGMQTKWGKKKAEELNCSLKKVENKTLNTDNQER